MVGGVTVGRMTVGGENVERENVYTYLKQGSVYLDKAQEARLQNGRLEEERLEEKRVREVRVGKLLLYNIEKVLEDRQLKVERELLVTTEAY